MKRREFNKLACFLPFLGLDIGKIKSSYTEYKKNEKDILDMFGQYDCFTYYTNVTVNELETVSGEKYKYLVFPFDTTLNIKYQNGEITFYTVNLNLKDEDIIPSDSIDIKQKNIQNAADKYMNKLTRIDIQKFIKTILDSKNNSISVEVNGQKWIMSSL